MSWIYNGKLVNHDTVPTDAVGFVYKIVHIPTGKFYIGKKSLIKIRRLKPLRGKIRKRVVRGHSDWETYYSSNKWIKSEVKSGKTNEFEREIIQFCFSKKSLTYWEVWWQFKLDVLANPLSINENLMGKFFRKDLK
jgi:hypothetical protein